MSDVRLWAIDMATGELIRRDDIEKHLQGRHDQRSHGRSKSPEGLVVNLAAAKGGATLDDNRRMAPVKHGVVVGVRPKESFHKNFREVNKADIKGWLDSHAKMLAPRDMHVGVWVDNDSGELWLDVVKVYPQSERRLAIASAKRHNQIAVYDLDHDREIQTGGTGIAKADEDISFAVFPPDVDADSILRWCYRQAHAKPPEG